MATTQTPVMVDHNDQQLWQEELALTELSDYPEVKRSDTHQVREIPEYEPLNLDV